MTDLFLQSLRNNSKPKKKESLHRGCSGRIHAQSVPKLKKEAPCPLSRKRSCMQAEEKEDYYQVLFGHSRCYSTRSLSSQSSTSSSGSDSSGYTSDKNSEYPSNVENSVKEPSKFKSESNKRCDQVKKKLPELIGTHSTFDVGAKSVKHQEQLPKKKTPEFILPYMYKGCYLYGRALSIVEEENEDDQLISSDDCSIYSPSSSRACTPTKLERVNTLHNLSLLLDDSTDVMQPNLGSRSCHACQIIFDLPSKHGENLTKKENKVEKSKIQDKSVISKVRKKEDEKAVKNLKPSPKQGSFSDSKNDLQASRLSLKRNEQVKSKQPAQTTPRKRIPPLKKSASDGVQNVFKETAIRRANSDSKITEKKQIHGSMGGSFKNNETRRKNFGVTSFRSKLLDNKNYCEKDSKLVEPKSDDELSRERSWLNEEKVWLPHNSGYSLVTLLKPSDVESQQLTLSDGKRKVKSTTGEIIDVSEDELEKANPPSCDKIEDLASLHFLNETSVLHTLRERFGNSLVHTYAGPAMVIMNPSSPLAVHSERMIHLFRGCKPEDMPPHIYSVTQSAYRQMLSTRCDQSLVFTGRSGSGKTFNFRHALHYLCVAAGSFNKVLTVEKLNAICLVLEAFGNCKTNLNSNATRFTEIFSLDFDQSGQIASASVQVLLPEYQRVSRRPKDEPTFHVFYEMIAGCSDEMKKQLGLENTDEPCAFLTPLQRQEDKLKAGGSWARVVSALELLGVKPTEVKAIWSVLAAIYHIGVAGAIKGSFGKGIFVKPQAAQRAATLLGISIDDLTNATFQVTSTNSLSPYRSSPSTERTSALEKKLEPFECLEGLAHGLYLEVLAVLVALINRSISSSANCISSLLLFDSPGFQNGATCRSTSFPGATFTDMQHNYLQERLQQLFYDVTVGSTKDKYEQENIEFSSEIEHDDVAMSVSQLLDLKPPNALARSSFQNIRDAGKRGLLWMLDEESLVTNVSDEELVKRILDQFSDKEYGKALEKGPTSNQFIIRHLRGTNPVVYTASGWLKLCRENPIIGNVSSLLQESIREEISYLFSTYRGATSVSLSGSVAGLEGHQSLRRVTSMRRTFNSGTAGIKRKSISIQVKYQVDAIIETLRKSRPKFVYCFLPHHNAGISVEAPKVGDECVNLPLLRSQIRGSQILAALRLHRLGFPECILIEEFCRRFSFKSESQKLTGNEVGRTVEVCKDILLQLDVEPSAYQIGLSQLNQMPVHNR